MWQPFCHTSLLRMAVLRSTAAQVQTVPGREQGSSRGHRNTLFPMGQGSATLCETLCSWLYAMPPAHFKVPMKVIRLNLGFGYNRDSTGRGFILLPMTSLAVPILTV